LLHDVRLEPRLAQARRELVYIYGIQLRRAEPDAQFQALSELGPPDIQDVYLGSPTRGCTWDPAEALPRLGQFVQADPDDRWRLPMSDPEARTLRVRLALDRGDLAAAEALLSEGPADHTGLALLRGRMAFLRHDGPAAVGHLRAAYAKAPDDRDVQFYLGQALRLAGDHEAAEPLLQLARKQDALAALVARAVSAAERANPTLPRRLGAACEAARRRREAVARYTLAISRDPLDRQAQEALYRLKTATHSDR
jgi:tetratricopeptide (TPR) repeat protein